MNIFVLDRSPAIAAEYHNNKHVIKMILETAQLLCSVHHMTGNPNVPYRLTHKNHPCSIWVRESLANYVWLLQLGVALGQEYTYRYGKRHKSSDVIESLPLPNLDDKGITPFAQAMPEAYRHDKAVDAYRAYYCAEKASISEWKRRSIPSWFSRK